MPATALSDEMLLEIAKHGRQDLVEKMRPADLRRFARLAKGFLSDQKNADPAIKEASIRKKAALSAFKTPETKLESPGGRFFDKVLNSGKNPLAVLGGQIMEQNILFTGKLGQIEKASPRKAGELKKKALMSVKQFPATAIKRMMDQDTRTGAAMHTAESYKAIANTVKDIFGFVAGFMGGDLAKVHVASKLVKNLAKAQLETTEEFIFEPGMQFARDPVEFGLNAIDAVGTIALVPAATKGIRVAAAGVELSRAIRAAETTRDAAAIVSRGEDILNAVAKAHKGVMVPGKAIDPIEKIAKSVIVQGVEDIKEARVVLNSMERLGVANLPHGFSGMRRKVNQLPPQKVLDELAPALGVERADAKRQLADAKGGLGWARDVVARQRLLQEEAKDIATRKSFRTPRIQPPDKPYEALVKNAAKKEESVPAIMKALDVTAKESQEAAVAGRAAGLGEPSNLAAKNAQRADAARDKIAARHGKTRQQELDDIRSAKRTPEENKVLQQVATERLSIEAGTVSSEMLARMAASTGGSIIAGTIAGVMGGDEDGFSMGWGLFGGLAGAFLPLVTSKRFLSIGDEAFDLEKDISSVMERVLPDRVIDLGTERIGRISETGLMFAGAATGALSGVDDEGQFDLTQTLLRAGLGAGVGKAFGRTIAKGQFNPRRVYQHWVKEQGTLPDNLFIAQKAFRARHDGRVAVMIEAKRTLDKGTKAQKADMTAYIHGEMPLTGVAPKFQDAAQATRDIFDSMAIDLVEAGAVEGVLEQVFLNNLGTYMPRVYMALEREDDVVRAARYLHYEGQNMSRLGEQHYTKARKNVSEDVAEAWEVINENNPDPGFILGRKGPPISEDIAVHEMMNFVASSPEHVLTDDLVRSARGDIDHFLQKKGMRKPKGGAEGEALERQVLEDSARVRDELDIKFHTRHGPQGPQEVIQRGNRMFIKMPSGKKLGVLKDRWVNEEVADHFRTLQTVPETFTKRILKKGTALFKAANVTLNPSTQVRNIFGQTLLTDVAGVGPWRVDKYGNAMLDYAKKRPLYREGQENGLFGGNWFGPEVGDMLKQVSKGKPGERSVLDAMLDWTDDTIGRAAEAPLKQATRLHSAIEDMNKMVLYRHARKTKGLSATDSVAFAKKWGFDYREVPRWIDVTRKSIFGAPFISFSYKAFPRVIESAMAVGDPMMALRFWKYPATMAAINEYSARKLGFISGKDETGAIDTMERLALKTIGLATGVGNLGDPKDFTKYLPSYSGKQQVLLPWRDKFQRPQSLDMTWYLPWGDMGEIGKGTIGKNLAKIGIPFPNALEPSNPWLNTIVAAKTNRDPFTGHEIIPPGMDRMDGIRLGLKWFGNQWAPGFVSRQIPQLQDALSGNIASKNPNQPGVGGSIGKMVAFQANPFDPRTSIEFKIRDLEKLKASLGSQVGRANTDAGVESLVRKQQEIGRQLVKLWAEWRSLPPTPPEFAKAKAAHKAAVAKSQSKALKKILGETP